MRQFLIAALTIPALASALAAESPLAGIRPEARPSSVRIVAAASRAIDAATRLSTDVSMTKVAPVVSAPATGMSRSLRPRPRPENLTEVAYRGPTPESRQQAVADFGFQRWVKGFRTRAQAQGISLATLNAAFSHAEFLPDVIERDGNQAEFTLSVGQYLGRAVSDARVSTGRANAQTHARTLAAIEARYDVDREIVAAIWGMESNYGANRGKTHLISALATLAYDGRRGSFFEKQLIAALKILQTGDTTEDRMLASWAGAMGHTQFIPTSYLAYAVDFTGDGKRDIWADDPSDALASTAAYLAKSGWIKGQPWGVEVNLPKGFDFTHAAGKRMPSDWARLGVKGVDGKPVPDHGTARLLLPAGALGIAFLVFKNFDVIRRYNASDAYALGVGHLGDRINGRGPLAGSWPEGERSLLRAEARELQSLLSAKGYATGGVDGKIGSKTIAAIRAYQKASGIAADGYPSLALLTRLRS
ncbi:lytic murein transglycosylase [Pseudooceanicola sp.]|uniref:lytic murein transglycosylase n=1 Tax=Pseudooceanicola sp. TaxID=1914328 RepID=UPI00261BE019|nr:lytic murein transglycosylase [Pseudooceanicola sp.]MDF1856174.1 lytic murein transglycosylase [Pseudooceanicola sp.]